MKNATSFPYELDLLELDRESIKPDSRDPYSQLDSGIEYIADDYGLTPEELRDQLAA